MKIILPNRITLGTVKTNDGVLFNKSMTECRAQVGSTETKEKGLNL